MRLKMMMIKRSTSLLIVSLFLFCTCQAQVKDKPKVEEVSPDKKKEHLVSEDDYPDLAKQKKYPKTRRIIKPNLSEEALEVKNWFNLINTYKGTTYKRKLIRTNAEYQDLLFHANLSTIKSLELWYILEEDPIQIEDLSKFTNLEYLKLVSFEKIPTGFYKLKNLKAFIAVNELKDQMSDEIVQLKNLEYIKTYFTYLVLPNNIHELENLETLIMYNFSRSQQPYDNIYKIPNLKTLGLKLSNEEQLSGISQLTNLKTLCINKVSPEIGQLNLSGLIINENSQASYPVELAALENLVAFYWQGNSERESPPEFVSKLKNLEYLEFRGCRNLNMIPEAYNEFQKLKEFKIAACSKLSKDLNHLENIKDVIRY